MRINEELLEQMEELFDLIPNGEGCVGLDKSMDKLRRFLEDDVDGRTHETDDFLIFYTLCRLDEIWELVSPVEKKDPDLVDYYREFSGRLREEDDARTNKRRSGWDDISGHDCDDGSFDEEDLDEDYFDNEEEKEDPCD